MCFININFSVIVLIIVAIVSSYLHLQVIGASTAGLALVNLVFLFGGIQWSVIMGTLLEQLMTSVERFLNLKIK